MALIPCPECKKRISDSAGACPKCGIELTPDLLQAARRGQSLRKRFVGIVVLALVVMAVIGSQFDKSDRGPAPYMLKRAHEFAIKDMMHDPESATFDEHSVAETLTEDKTKWVAMTSSVTGGNLLGGRRRKWVVTVVRWVFDGAEWKAEFPKQARSVEDERPKFLDVHAVMAQADWPRDAATNNLRTDPTQASGDN